VELLTHDTRYTMASLIRGAPGALASASQLAGMLQKGVPRPSIMARANQQGIPMQAVDDELKKLRGADGGSGGGGEGGTSADDDGSGAVVSPERLELFSALCQRSQSTGYDFPTTDNRLSNLCTTSAMKDAAVRHAETTRPLLPASAAQLCEDFLEMKREHGSDVEQKVYSELTLTGFMDRLLTKRPLVFYTSADNYLLKSGQSGADPAGWDAVGSDAEGRVLCLEDVMSYDELCISALMAVSTPTHFINNGNRGNMGTLDLWAHGCDPRAQAKVEPTGVYIGQVCVSSFVLVPTYSLVCARVRVPAATSQSASCTHHQPPTAKRGAGGGALRA
jgi:hypothetical protein